MALVYAVIAGVLFSACWDPLWWIKINVLVKYYVQWLQEYCICHLKTKFVLINQRRFQHAENSILAITSYNIWKENSFLRHHRMFQTLLLHFLHWSLQNKRRLDSSQHTGNIIVAITAFVITKHHARKPGSTQIWYSIPIFADNQWLEYPALQVHSYQK